MHSISLHRTFLEIAALVAIFAPYLLHPIACGIVILFVHTAYASFRRLNTPEQIFSFGWRFCIFMALLVNLREARSQSSEDALVAFSTGWLLYCASYPDVIATTYAKPKSLVQAHGVFHSVTNFRHTVDLATFMAGVAFAMVALVLPHFMPHVRWLFASGSAVCFAINQAAVFDLISWLVCICGFCSTTENPQATRKPSAVLSTRSGTETEPNEADGWQDKSLRLVKGS